MDMERALREDWPVDGFWNHLLLGHNSEPGVLSVYRLSAPAHPAAVRPPLTDVEAALRADGWTIDGLEPLTAHKADLAIEIRDDTGHRELALTARPDPTPALPVITAGLAGAGIALMWLPPEDARRIAATRRIGRVSVTCPVVASDERRATCRSGIAAS